MVLWSNKGRIARWLFRKKMRTRRRKVRRSERGKGRRGFKPDAAAGSTRKPERNHIRLRWGGISAIKKIGLDSTRHVDFEMLTALPVKTASPPPESRSRSSKLSVPH